AAGPWPVRLNEVEGYIKSPHLLVCPSFKDGTTPGAYGNSIYTGFIYYRKTTYGYNNQYMVTGANCQEGPDSDPANYPSACGTTAPISLAAIEEPSNTLAFTESSLYDSNQGWVSGYYIVRPPHAWEGYDP